MAEVPEEILRRSAEARAAADGISVDEVLARWRGDTPTDPAAPVTDEPAAAPPTAPVAADTPAAAPAAAAMSVEEYARAAATAAGMPEKLLMRSANAKAKAQGVPIENILAEMAGLPAPGADPALAPTGTNGTTAVAVVPAPGAAPAAAPAAPVAAPPAAAAAMSVEEYAKAAPSGCSRWCRPRRSSRSRPNRRTR
jgi:hypothetical protein